MSDPFGPVKRIIIEEISRLQLSRAQGIGTPSLAFGEDLR